MSLLADLVAAGTVRCPSCRGALVLAADRARCGGCGRDFAFANGALDLYGARPVADAAVPDAAFVRAVARALRLPETPDGLARVAQAVAGTAASGDDPHLAAEIAELADRLGIPGPAAPAPPASPAPAPVAAAPVVVEWGPCFVEAAMPPRTTVLRSIRLRNAGGATLSSTGRRPAFLSYHWLHADGRMAVFEGERSRLPVPLAPGRALTVIAHIATPAAPGDYRLAFQLLVEGERWLEPAAPAIAVRIARDAAPPAGYAQTGQAYDYGADHHVAAEMVYAHIRRHWPTTPLRVLEVGGGTHPSLAGLARFGHTVTALDVSFPMSQLGALCHGMDEGLGGRVAFVACDAAEPPLADGAFDCAAIFAALHHFPEPDRLLATLARLVRPEGFIAVMCEPCLPDPEAAMYLRDLAKGINEQAWSLPEWHGIFTRAGLRLVEGRVDTGSLKALLAR